MKYIVSVTRIGYGGLDLEVEADSEDKAKEIALDQAGGESFSEHHSQYQVDQVAFAEVEKPAVERIESPVAPIRLRKHRIAYVLVKLLDDDYGVSEAAYSAMKDAGMVPDDIANRVKATDGRFYLPSESRGEGLV